VEMEALVPFEPGHSRRRPTESGSRLVSTKVLVDCQSALKFDP
jgi:hypothetical protein